MHRAYAATQDRGRLVFALTLVAVVVGGWSSGSQAGPSTLLKLDSGAIAFGLNGPRFAWVGQHVVVADLASGKRSRLARGRTDYEEPVGVAASTVVWLEMVGGNAKIDTLRAASPGHEVRFGRWIDDDWYLGSGPRFGGVAAEETTLVYGVYALTSLEQKSDRCYTDGVCHWRVSGGGTFLVRPGSLERQRILPPSTAVAGEGETVAAATLARGERFKRREQIVLLNLADGSQRRIGKPLSVQQLLLHGDRVAAISAHGLGPATVHVLNIKTGAEIRTLRLPTTAKVVPVAHFAWSRGRLLFMTGQAIRSLDLRSGALRVVARTPPQIAHGPWVWHGRVLWVEQHHQPLLKSMPL